MTWDNVEIVEPMTEIVYERTPDGWRNPRTGSMLSSADIVCLRVNGAYVLAVNPVTREATRYPQSFMVTAIDGRAPSFSPKLDHPSRRPH